MKEEPHSTTLLRENNRCMESRWVTGEMSEMGETDKIGQMGQMDSHSQLKIRRAEGDLGVERRSETGRNDQATNE
jgi:hypothetical protein